MEAIAGSLDGTGPMAKARAGTEAAEEADMVAAVEELVRAVVVPEAAAVMVAGQRI